MATDAQREAVARKLWELDPHGDDWDDQKVAYLDDADDVIAAYEEAALPPAVPGGGG
jgi:hypothetical protein